MCGTLAKDFHKLMKNIASFSNSQANVADYEETLDEFKLEISPNDGLYRGGKFEFEVKIQDYPKIAPNVTCTTQIYHPNIDDAGEICLNLFSEWAETNTLEDCVQGLLFLLYNPNLEDPLSPWFDPEDDTDLEDFAQNVRLSLEGGVVEGNEFERNLVDEASDTNENANTEESQETTNGEGAVVEADDGTGALNEIQEGEEKLNNLTTDSSVEVNTTTTVTVTCSTEATEDTTDSNVPTRSEETTDFISGKLNPHRTEDEIFVTKENGLV
ncbi:nedd8-conjugating enzyme UbcE2M-like [Oculina patagonica]